MENQIFVFEHPQFGKVHGYLDARNTAYFKLEDIARVLGFTQIAKSGNIVVRWERVNKYLREFGFIPMSGDGIPTNGDDFGKEDFIPENMVYRLAMKANNENAVNFQMWLANDVVPSIRKTGSYSLPKDKKPVAVENQPPVLHKLLDDINKSSKLMEEIFKVKNGIALAKSISVVEKINCVDLSEVKELLPPAEHEIGYFTPTQLAKKFGLRSAQTVNQKLVELGLQEKNGKDGYLLTEKGKNYGETIPYDKNGHSGYQIKWCVTVSNFFEIKI